MRKTSYLLLAVCMVLMAVPSWAQPGKPKMILPEQSYDAGQVYRDAGNIEHSFAVRNEGKADLLIYDVNPG